MNIGVTDSLLSRSSSCVVSKWCAAQYRPITDVMVPYLIITAVCSLRVCRRLCLLQSLRRHADLCVLPTAADLLVGPEHRSRAGAAIWRCHKRMQLADGAAQA